MWIQPLPKILGCCSQCDELVFEVHERFGADHLLAGRARRVGRPLETAIRVWLVLTNGSPIAVTFCEACVQAPRLVEVWKRTLAAFAEEMTPEYRQAIGNRGYTDEQYRIVMRTYLRLAGMVPLGVLCQYPWLQEPEYA